MGRADVDIVEVSPFIGNGLIPHKRPLAVRAVNQAPENMGDRSQTVMPPQPFLVGTAGLRRHPLNGTEGFFIHQRLMSIADNHPLGFRCAVRFSPFGKSGPLASLYHVPQVNLVGEDFLDRIDAPKRIGIAFRFRVTFQIVIPGRRRDAPLVQLPGNTLVTQAGKPPLKHFPHHWRSLCVRLDPVTVIRAFLIAIRRPGADKFPVLTLGCQGWKNLSGYILAVNIVHDVFQRHDIAVL